MDLVECRSSVSCNLYTCRRTVLSGFRTGTIGDDRGLLECLKIPFFLPGLCDFFTKLVSPISC